MWNLVHDSGFAAWITLALTASGVILTLTRGRQRGNPAGVATAFAVAILASAAIGMATGQHKVEQATLHMSADLATRFELSTIGTREASGNLLLGGGGALLVSALGGVLALMPPRSGLRAIGSRAGAPVRGVSGVSA